MGRSRVPNLMKVVLGVMLMVCLSVAAVDTLVFLHYIDIATSCGSKEIRYPENLRRPRLSLQLANS